MVVDSACLENFKLMKPLKPLETRIYGLTPWNSFFFQGRPGILHSSPFMDISMEWPEYVCLLIWLGQV